MEYQVFHTLKKLGETPYGSVEMCDENRNVVFRLEEKFNNRSSVFASYKLLQRIIHTCRRNKVSKIHVSTNDKLVASELQYGETVGSSSSLYRQTMHYFNGIEIGNVDLRN